MLLDVDSFKGPAFLFAVFLEEPKRADNLFIRNYVFIIPAAI